MSGWTVHFVSEEAEAEFEALPLDIKARMTRTLEIFEAKGLAALVMPLARAVEGKLWELRASGRDGIARCFYVTATARRLVILRTFIKTTQKTPREELALALKRLKEVE